MSFSTLYAYMYCMMVSNALLEMPIFGGALFMSGRVSAIYFEIFTGPGKMILPRRMRWIGPVALGFLMLCNLALLMFYPATIESAAVWILFAMVLSIFIRSAISRQLISLRVQGRLTAGWFAAYFTGLHLLMGGIVIFIMTRTVEPISAWTIFGGYVMLALMEAYSHWKERRAAWPQDQAVTQVESLEAELQKVNAFTAYRWMHGLVLAAIQVTLVTVYTYIAFSAQQILNSMILSLLCTLAARELTDFGLRRAAKGKELDKTYLLLVGVFLWLYGLLVFSNMIKTGSMGLSVYVSLALCACGATVCATCLAGMEQGMLQVARFGLRADQVEGYAPMRHIFKALAQLGGQMLALAGLTALCFINGADLPREVGDFARSFRPALVIPALLMVIAAAVSAWRFPLSQRHLDKLGKFFQLKEAGATNRPLEKPLEEVVLKRHRKMYGIKILAACVRPFYRHKIIGKENVDASQEGLIFICNHGEYYGPVVTNVYVPFPFRPWSISDLMDDLDTVAEFCYKYEISPITWLSERWKRRLARLMGKGALWMTRSIEAIPVYRNKPRMLMQTFRLSVEAMEAGDSLLIFPENPDAKSLAQPGYVSEGVGEFFTGFTMLGQLYHNRTGKYCTFVPIFADKKRRVISFGKGVRYDPERPPVEEKVRIVSELKGAMEAMQAKIEKEYA
ncbi:MAG: hypothetical protein IJ461_03515 [Clostridia bacterium]|nr:hypothetical protein [Clostridia bacterium]